MYSVENISTIFDFRNLSTDLNGNAIDRPSDELILSSLDLVRKLIKTPEPEIIINTVGIDIVIQFKWNVGDFGIIEYTLSEKYLRLFVLDSDSNILVNDVELDNSEFQSIDFITTYFIGVITGELPNIWGDRKE